MKALSRIEREHLKKEIPDFSVGDTVRVHVKVIEGDKVRTQKFQGTVIGRRGGGIQETFVVRKISANIAVERIFPIHSPTVEAIELVRHGRVRRAQLNYMKDRKGKRARVAGRRLDLPGATAAPATAESKAEDQETPAETSAD
jgi:large subunit ribosomal protein L19